MLKKYVVANNLNLMDKYYKNDGFKIKIRNFERTYCKCGEVYGSKITKCNCGNHNFVDLGEFRSYRSFNQSGFKRFEISPSPDPFEVYRVYLNVALISDKEISLVEDSELYLKLSKESAEIKTVHGYYGSYDIWDGIKSIKKDYLYYYLYKNVFESLPENKQSVKNFVYLVNGINKYPKLFTKDTVKRFPTFCLKLISDNSYFKVMESHKTFEEIMDYYGIDKRFYNYVDEIFSMPRYYYRSSNKGNKLFSNFYKLSDEYKDIIFTAFEQNTISSSNIETMSERILNIESLSPANEVEMVYKVAGSYKKETALVNKNDFILLPNFLKENLLIYGENTIDSYIERIKFLKDNKYEINEENMKTKKFRTILNYNELAEKHNYPEEKVDCFLDLIDVNPLKALAYIRDRRKLTKAQAEALLKEML